MPVERGGLGWDGRRQERAKRGLSMRLLTPPKVEMLRKALHAKAKADPGIRFYLLYGKVYRADILSAANCTQPHDLNTFFSACPARIPDFLLAVLAVPYGVRSSSATVMVPSGRAVVMVPSGRAVDRHVACSVCRSG